VVEHGLVERHGYRKYWLTRRNETHKRSNIAVQRVAARAGIGLLRGRRLAGDAEALDGRLNSRSVTLGYGDHHFCDGARHRCRDDLPAHPRRGLSHELAAATVYAAHQNGFHQASPIGDRSRGHRHLQVGYADTVTEGGRRRLDVHPGTPTRQQHPRRLARQRHARLLAKAEATEHLVQTLTPDLQRELRHTHVRRDRQDLRQREPG
jgi:hypothetical protein